MQLTFLPWEPDKGPYSSTSTDWVLNVTPIANGYGPFGNLAALSSGLDATCVGAAFFRDSAGGFGLVAGTQTGLFLYNKTDGTWSDISGASAPFSVPDGQYWQFARFGTKLYATNLDDVLQVYDVDAGGTFGAAPGSPPQAKYIAAVGDFLFLAYLKVGADELPQSWRHSGLNDAAVWTIGTKHCDGQDIPDGDEVMGILSVPGGARIFQRNAIRRLTFTPSSTFAFLQDDVDATEGVLAPYSIVAIGRGDYVYLAEDGFYRGDARSPIGAERVNRWFFENTLSDRLGEMMGAVDPFSKITWWLARGSNIGRVMIGYDWQLDRWTQVFVQAADGQLSVLITAATAGYTLEGLDQFGTIDTLTASLDSDVWKGGTPFFGAFDTSLRMFDFSGANAQAVIHSGATELVSGSRSFVNGCRVVSDADDYSVTVATADFHGGPETDKSPSTPSTITGMTPLRASGRLHRFKTTITTGDVWGYAHGVDLTGFVQPEGQR